MPLLVCYEQRNFYMLANVRVLCAISTCTVLHMLQRGLAWFYLLHYGQRPLYILFYYDNKSVLILTLMVFNIAFFPNYRMPDPDFTVRDVKLLVGKLF